MTEVRRADPTARRVAALFLVVGTCVGALLIAVFTRYRIPLSDWVLADRAQRVKVVWVFLTALVSVPLLGLAVYLWSLGERVVRAREFPPPGLRIIRDTAIITGERAVVRSRLIKALAIGCGTASIVLAGLLAFGLWLRAVLLVGVIVAGAALASELDAESLDAAKLARTAAAKGCKTEPTDYVAGYFAPDDALSGVFWCRANLDDLDPQFLIIVVDQHARRPMSCPDTMQSVNRPLGLRILRDAQVPLSWFHSPSHMAKTGPVGPHTTGPVIDTGDGGIGEQWICHDGAWLLHVYH